MVRQVKIVATIGPATASAEALLSLREAGMDMARLNGSHADLEWHRGAISLIRETLPDLPILLDLPGDREAGKDGFQTRFESPVIPERDLALIALACETGLDFVGVSYVNSAAQVKAIRSEIGGLLTPAIVSKIETQGALDHLGEILAVSDAIMIDRGDLSVQTSIEGVTLLQKKVVQEARMVSCPVIIATEMLESMIHNPTPTKAEVSDITNAVLDGASAVMLSAETAIGKYPVESVRFMRRIADKASESLHQTLDTRDQRAEIHTVPEAMGEAIALICRKLEVTKIVAITFGGYAARVIAANLPSQPILAVSNSPARARCFNLYHGTKGIFLDIPFSRTSTEHIPLCLEQLWRQGELVDEDLILVTAVIYPKSGNRMNLIETHHVSDLKESLGWL